jgi:hypothetical protein
MGVPAWLIARYGALSERKESAGKPSQLRDDRRLKASRPRDATPMAL